MKIFDANISGSLTVSGSAHFQSDITVDGTINATISGTTSNASALNTTGSARFATTGSNLFKADQTHSGSIIPAVNVAYDLGDPTHWWKDIYVSTGSIYIGGIKAISTNSDGSIQIGAQVLQTSASLALAGLPVPPTGSGGSSEIIIVGSQNITGSQAITGSMAVSGSLVVTGSLFINGSSYTAATSGTSGSSGSNGTNGSSGTSGSNGTNGSSGTNGTSGSNGTNGSSGTSGSNGTNGSSGSSGSNGTNGSSGTSGSNGTNGSSGSSGTVTITGTQDNGIFTLNGSSPNATAETNLTFDGSLLKINGNQEITGSLTVTQNLTVLGSSSITYVTSSQLRVDDNIITVNTAGVAQRFGGLEIYDSGSSPATASLLWDSVNNKFLYSHPVGADTYNSAWIISGPKNSGELGSEVGLTTNKITKAVDDDHIGDSNISDTGTKVSINSNTEVTGSLIVTAGITGALTGNASTATTAGTVTTAAQPSITSVGTLTSLTVNGAVTLNAGTTAVTGALIVGGATTSTTVGLIRASNDVIAYASSDERLKENLLTISGSLDILKQINGYYFDWITMEGVHENEGHDIGVIAQEIEKVLPEVVTTRENGYMAVKYEKLVALLIQTNKELLARVEALEEKIK